MRIGIFDSGLGGLTAVRELELRRPDAGYVYFGDTARVPYGGRSKEVLDRYAVQDSRFLISKKVDAIMVACCTVSANCLDTLENTFDIPFYGVIEPAVRAAAQIASAGNGKIAVLCTSATLKSGTFERSIKKLDPSLSVTSKACPLLVPLVENGRISVDDPLANIAVSEYVSGLAEAKPSAVIMGCTHYPLLSAVLEKYLPESTLVNCSAETVKEILSDLIEHGYVTGKPYLGIQVKEVNEQAQIYGIPAGASVSYVAEGSCAQKAGLQVNDIITAIDDTAVDSPSALTAALSSNYKAGDTATLTVIRNQQEQKISITFDEKNEQTEAANQVQQNTQQNQQGQSGNGYYYQWPFGGFNW